MTVFWSEWFC